MRGDVLDVGCGSQPYKRLFVGNPASAVTSWTGLDKRPVGDVAADAHNMTMLADGSFDTVLLTDTLNYCLLPLQVVGECKRVLRPGGHLVVCEPNTYEDDHERLWGIRESGLGECLVHHGFKIVDIGTHGGLWREEVSNMQQAQKYGVPIGQAMDTLMGALDVAFPVVTSAIAVKE